MECRKVAVTVAVILCALGISTPDANAVGFGFYVNAGGGSGDETPTFESGQEDTQDTSNSHFGFGFAFDTNVLGRSGIFNYRLNFGYEKMKTEVDDAAAVSRHEVDWGGAALEQDFGFGGKVGERVRLWGGPCIRLSYHEGSDEFDNDFSVVGFGIGPVFGANFGVADALAFSVRAGFLIDGYGGDWSRPSGGSSMDFSMSEIRAFVGFGMLFGN